ncbi:MAG: 2-C-methyl-D-erythritol 4-phosphate cytidylyltransferase [Deltaproteobacteria bacterium]|nr:2-C-methyl-D-erythritol 4-phosphate cytidylyltransferase [Deltaproteobacteria bacterium]
MTTSAIIVAAGHGLRMGAASPKQFLAISGVPILARAILPFEKAPSLQSIVIVTLENYIEYVKRDIVDAFSLTKVKAVVAGGMERQDSVLRGISAVDPLASLIIIHDGVRPFVTVELIEDIISAAMMYGAAVPGIPMKETVKKINASHLVEATIDRKDLWLVQTPQGFQREVIENAYHNAYAEGFVGTDDAMLVERLGFKVRLVPGFQGNIKVTTPEDLRFGGMFIDEDKNWHRLRQPPV